MRFQNFQPIKNRLKTRKVRKDWKCEVCVTKSMILEPNPSNPGKSWVPKSAEFCKRNIGSTNSKGCLNWLSEPILMIRGAFESRDRACFGKKILNKKYCLEIYFSALGKCRHDGFLAKLSGFWDPVFFSQPADSWISVTQTSKFRSFLTLWVFNRFLIGWKFWNRVIFLFAFFWGLTLLQSLFNLVCQ